MQTYRQPVAGMVTFDRKALFNVLEQPQLQNVLEMVKQLNLKYKCGFYNSMYSTNNIFGEWHSTRKTLSRTIERRLDRFIKVIYGFLLLQNLQPFTVHSSTYYRPIFLIC